MTCTKNTRLGTVLYSTQNEASLNIVESLKKDWAWKEKRERLITFSACGKSDCCTGFSAVGYDLEITRIEPDFDASYFIYASTHKSESKKPALTAHFPGNWSDADFGGGKKTLNVAYACKLKQILKFIDEGNSELGLGWEVCAEVDHHGPTPKNGSLPLIFAEIGSTSQEWKNPVAAKIVSSAIFKALVRKTEQWDTYIAFGGGHYAPAFTDFILGKKMLDGKEIAISHMCPKYRADNIDAQMVRQAVQKTVEPVAGALVDKKGLDSKQREIVCAALDEAKIRTIII